MEIAPTHSPSQLQLQPLHCACQNGHVEAVRMLIETFHADPNTAVEVGDSFRKKDYLGGYTIFNLRGFSIVELHCCSFRSCHTRLTDGKCSNLMIQSYNHDCEISICHQPGRAYLNSKLQYCIHMQSGH